MYDRLFLGENPEDVPEGQTFLNNMNPRSLEVIHAKLEPSLGDVSPASHFQFERMGYFFTDPVDSKPGKPIFNGTVGFRDTWAKVQLKGETQ